MKNLSRTTYVISIVMTFAFAFTLGACVASNVVSSSTAAQVTSSAQIASETSSAPGSSNAVASEDSSNRPDSSDSEKSFESGDSSDQSDMSESLDGANITVTRNGSYTDKEHVALYIHTYGTVPSNYISKTKARKAGWDSEKGNLWKVLPGMSIGGGGFYNDEGMLPDAQGREWFECDIDYEGGFRNAKRIVYSNDGLIYYTDDHYKTFERLY